MLPATRSRPNSICSAVLGVLAFGSVAAQSARAADPTDQRIKTLFAEQCALCHDADGRALGPIARTLSPAPRDFGEGLFQLSSGDNGVPMIQDLERVIARGLPGSAMPAFPEIGAADRRGLAEFVRELAIDAITERVTAELRERGETIDPKEARALAEWRMTPVEFDPFPSFPPADEATLAKGRRLYEQHCLACHGADGGGRAVVPGWQDFQYVPARDLRIGILKGGAGLQDIARRIRAGMPGRGMPPTLLEQGDTEVLAVYVESLLPADAATRWEQRSETILVRRVAGSVIHGADDAAWNRIPETRLVLTPLASRGDVVSSVVEARVAAVHDGVTLAIRIRWPDTTRDDPAANAVLPDGVGLQFSSERSPPVMGMGALHQPHDLWFWRTFDPERGAAAWSNFGRRGLGSGLSRPAKATTVAGAQSASPAYGDAEIEANASHDRGEWRVVLRRRLIPKRSESITFAPGGDVRVALGIWNGAAGDAGARKSISLWSTLDFDR
jgi:DMSO reductase family type II enzyme heme b subunit